MRRPALGPGCREQSRHVGGPNPLGRDLRRRQLAAQRRGNYVARQRVQEVAQARLCLAPPPVGVAQDDCGLLALHLCLVLAWAIWNTPEMRKNQL